MKKTIIAFCTFISLSTASSAGANSLTVTTKNDTGPGSLRQAILDANSNSGPDTITFSVSGTINDDQNTNGNMPHITDDGTTIDATGQSITIKAAGAHLFPPPIVIDSANNTVRGFTITGYTGDDGLDVNGNNNLISQMVLNGNGQGLRINGNNNNVEGCFIGTNETGTTAVANAFAGIIIQLGATGNTIGGTTPAQRNIISGNGTSITRHGILVDGAPGNFIVGNFIGTNAAGTAAIPNGGDGILLDKFVDFSAKNVIGGTAAGAANLISGNGGNGIEINDATSTGNRIEGNLIGTQVNGTSALANGVNGILISNALNNTIGGADSGAGNTIAFDTGRGVAMTGTAAGNAILANAIFSNGSLGIDLKQDGVTPNDAGDGDTGANRLQNFPVLTVVSTASGKTRVQGTLNSAPSADFRLEFFSNAACDASGNGEGQAFLGAANVTTNASGDASFDAVLTNPSDFRVTATATDALNNTSEFSACAVTAHPGSIQFSSALYSVNESDGSATVTVTRVGGSDGIVSADFATSAGTATPDTDYADVMQTVLFAAGDTAAKTVSIPIVSDSVVEGTETVNLALSNPTGAALLGAQSTAVLNIMDNCGDGVQDPGEQCDDGNNVDDAVCDSNCTLPACGNGILDAGEECDGSADAACPGKCITADSPNECRCPPADTTNGTPGGSSGGSGSSGGTGNGTAQTSQPGGCTLIP